MRERIKAIRKAAELTQSEFGDKIGVKGNTVTGYESGLRSPSDAVIKSICREFNVNEVWLRTGEGDEMFIPKTTSSEISSFIGEILRGEPDFRRRFIAVLARMTPDEWKLLEKKALELVEELKKTDT